MGHADLFLSAVQAHLLAVERNLDAIVSAADRAAELIVKGARIFADSDEEGFTSELCYRSGGLMGILPAPEPDAVKESDVVIVGSQDRNPGTQVERVRAFADKGAYLVAVGSRHSCIHALASAGLDTTLAAGAAPVVPFRKSSICPCAGTLNIAAAWVFVAELVSACLRRGQVPVCYQSGAIPDGSARNARYTGRMFHAEGDFAAAPIPEGEKGSRYLAELHRSFSGLRLLEGRAFAEAGAAAAAAIERGGTVWCDALGHHMPAQRGAPGDPGLFSLRFPERGEKEKNLRPGDLYIYNGYYVYPKEELELVRKAGIRSVWVTGGREVQTISALPGEIHIDAHWRFGDACLAIPGYDVRIVPESGVIMTTTLWMLVAAAAELTS